MNSYLFYDLETTGLNKAFDQVLQFACIRTDMAFNEIERESILIKLREDVIYAPEALITNRISIAEANRSGICEYEAIKHIHQLLNTPETISIGYNSFGFDDEFLRFCFYRNLLQPYTHQYQNGCFRMDMLPITLIYWLYKRNVIQWPEINGTPTLKLEYLSATNKLTEGRAHDALFDVEATVELARRMSRETATWNYICGHFDKKVDRSRTKSLPPAFDGHNSINHVKGLLIGSEFGPRRNYQAPVLSLGSSIPYSNQRIWLRLDLPELKTTETDTIPETTWAIRKKYGEPGMILPPLDRYWQRLTPECLEIVDANLKWLQTHPDLFQKIISYHCNYAYPEVPNIDPDAALYQIGFSSAQEQSLSNDFHSAPVKNKIKIIKKFPNPERRSLARRILWRNYGDELPASLRDEFNDFLYLINPSQQSEALIDYKGQLRRTPKEALTKSQQLLDDPKALDEDQLLLIEELKAYLQERFT